MNEKEIRALAWKNIKDRKKSTIIKTMLFALSMQMLILSAVFSGGVTNWLNELKDNYMLHIMYAWYSNWEAEYQGQAEEKVNELYERYTEDPRISDIGWGRFYNLYYQARVENAWELFDGASDNSISLYFVTYMDIMKQYTDYKGELGKYEVLLPKYIWVCYDGESGNYFVKKEEIHDATDLVGKTISVELVNPAGYPRSMGEIELKVAGILDNVKSHDLGEQIYVSEELMNECEKFWGDTSLDLYMVVDDMQDIEDIENEGYGFHSQGKLDPDMYVLEYMMEDIRLIGRIIFVFSIVIVLLFNIRNMRKRVPELAIMKAVGYSQSIVNRMMAYETLYIFGLSFVATIVASVAFVGIINIGKYLIFPVSTAKAFVFTLEPWHVLFGLLTVLVCAVIAYGFTMEKMTKENLLKTLRNK